MAKLKPAPSHLKKYRQGFINVFFFLFLEERNTRVFLSSKNKKKNLHAAANWRRIWCWWAWGRVALWVILMGEEQYQSEAIP